MGSEVYTRSRASRGENRGVACARQAVARLAVAEPVRPTRKLTGGRHGLWIEAKGELLSKRSRQKAELVKEALAQLDQKAGEQT